jgi:hypothetical protein
VLVAHGGGCHHLTTTTALVLAAFPGVAITAATAARRGESAARPAPATILRYE